MKNDFFELLTETTQDKKRLEIKFAWGRTTFLIIIAILTALGLLNLDLIKTLIGL